MDDFLSDVTLQILARTETNTLALLLPQFPKEVRDRINGPVFWKMRLRHHWPDELQDIEAFEKAYSKVKPDIDLELAARLVEYCEVYGCHVIVAALAFYNSPSMEVIKAALALMLGEAFANLEERVDPRDLNLEEMLVQTALDCCRHNPQHLGRIWSYLWRYELSEPEDVNLFFGGLTENLDNLSQALDTMSECLAWHAQMRLLPWLLWHACQAGFKKLASFLVSYLLRCRYYDVLLDTYRDSFLQWDVNVILTDELTTQEPGLLDLLRECSYVPPELAIDYALPPLYSNRAFPLPLINESPSKAEGRSLAEIYEVGRRSVFTCTGSQLVELYLEGVDVVQLLRKEVAEGFPYPFLDIQYSSFVVLHRLAPEVLADPSLRAWVEANQNDQQPGELVLYFLTVPQ